MALHPGERKRHFPEEVPVAWDPIRWALEENEDWYRDLVEHSQDLLCVHDLEGRLLSINPAPARLLGYSVAEILRMPMRDFLDPQLRAEFDVYLREIGRTGESRGLVAVVARSGERRIWEYHSTLRTEGVSAPIVRGMAHDVTERVRAEEALRRTNEQLLKTGGERERTLRELTLFRTLLDQTNDAIEVIGPETMRFLDVNGRACVALGYSREELLSMTVFDIDPNLDESSHEREEQRLRESGFATMERVHRRRDGTTFPVEVNLRKVQLEREYYVAVARDITERKRTEEALRESEARFRAVYERSPVGIALVDSRTGQYLQANPKFCEIAGRSEEELLRSDVESITHPDDIGESREYLHQLAEGRLANHELEKRYLRPDGSVRWARILVAQMCGDGETRRWHMSLVRDITERKRAEEALRQSEERFRVAIKHSPIAVYSLDRNLRYTWMYNPQLP
jgi:PAS domain S-box-containing protein